jgi:hypothetical protein
MKRPPSTAQRLARQRNHTIFRIRGLWHNLPIRDGDRKDRIRDLIDEELKSMGVESEGERELRRRKAWERPQS